MIWLTPIESSRSVRPDTHKIYIDSVSAARLAFLPGKAVCQGQEGALLQQQLELGNDRSGNPQPPQHAHAQPPHAPFILHTI